MTGPSPDMPAMSLVPRAAMMARQALREKLVYRELLVQITRRDIRLRYKHTAMGFGWAILMPSLHMVVFSLVFTRVVVLDTGLPYPLFAYCGLLAWNFSASALRFASTSLTSNVTLVTKVYFPREILPVSAVLVAGVDFVVASALLAGLILYYGVHPGWTVLLLPVIVLVQGALTTGLALLFAMGNLFYRDVKYLTEILLTVGMLATSVVYPVERVGGLLGRLLLLNPMTHVIDAYRAVLLQGELPAPGPLLASAAVSLLILVGSWIVFQRAQYQFAESI
jgi:ABC-type polysaccharide/polyol phosphate export permease